MEVITKRLDFIDSLKGLTILFVIYGHSIQYLRDGSDFLNNPVFEFIYSFHMPLFFLISGFFFNSSLKLNFKNFFTRKIIQLLLPCLVWAVLYESVHLITGYKFDWIREIKMLVNPFLWPFWFLRELFISYLLVYVSYKILKKKWIVFLFCIGFVLIAPFCGMQRFLLPMFLVGILLKDNYQFFLHYLKATTFLSGFLFLLCLFFWNGRYTIYVTAFPSVINLKTFSLNFTNIDIALFRLLIGVSGSIFLFHFFYMIHKFNWINLQLSAIGKTTLTIYILQQLFIENITNGILNFPTVNLWIYNLIITPLISFLVLMICIWITGIISKNKNIYLMLFGSTVINVKKIVTNR